MIYKFYKKNNEGEWYEADSCDYYSDRFDELIQNYSRNILETTRDGSNRNCYYIEDLNKIEINGTTNYSKDYTQTEFNSMNNNELIEHFNLIKCEICGRYEKIGNAIKVGRNHYYCSGGCASRVATRCTFCGNWYMNRTSIANNTHDCNFGEIICNKCFDKNIKRGLIKLCADCNRYELTSYGAVVHGNFYCRTCKERHVIPQVIQGYHATSRNWIMQHGINEDDTNALLYFGHETEIETADGSNNNEVAYDLKKIHDEDGLHYFYENDSSLCGRGFEIISHPATMQWYYENTEKIKRWLQFLISQGCKSHDTDTCGLHIHVSRNFFQDNNKIENRLGFLMEKLRVDLKKFTRRKTFYWCNFSSNNQEEVTLQNVEDKKRNMRGHHSALNLENRNTIEFRIFRGTLKFETLMATIELINNLCLYCNNIEDDSELEYTTFNDIINYHDTLYLKQYCIDRKIIKGGDSKCA